MKIDRYRLVGTILMVAVVGTGFIAGPKDTVVQAANPENVAAPRFQVPLAQAMGSATCASASCHGGGRVDRVGSELTTWAEGDPHFRAFQVLLNERSTRMIAALNAHRTDKLPPAHENVLCLKCHSSEPTVGTASNYLEAVQAAPALAYASESSRIHRTTGVSCESCHGPAEKYLTNHYLPSFKSLSVQEKANQYGLYPTKDLAGRMQVCAACHVGNEKQQVNHDLIAAGHPRLTFEYLSHHHHPNYRRHWYEKSPRGEFELRAWLMGQVAIADASVRLLQSRAEDHLQHQASWPELAEYSCYACHKSLPADADWFRWNMRDNRAPGSLPWQPWSHALLPMIANWMQQPIPEYRKLLQFTSVPANRLPKADWTLQQCKSTRQELQLLLQKLQQQPLSASDISKLLELLVQHPLTADGSKFQNQDWDTLTQHFLGLASLRYAETAWKVPKPHRQMDGSLDALRALFRFPKGYDSPVDLSIAKTYTEFRQLLLGSDHHDAGTSRSR